MARKKKTEEQEAEAKAVVAPAADKAVKAPVAAKLAADTRVIEAHVRVLKLAQVEPGTWNCTYVDENGLQKSATVQAAGRESLKVAVG